MAIVISTKHAKMKYKGQASGSSSWKKWITIGTTLSQASDAQYQAASHKAKFSIWHSKATIFERQGKIMSKMHKEQQNMVLCVAWYEQKYVKQLQRNSIK